MTAVLGEVHRFAAVDLPAGLASVQFAIVKFPPRHVRCNNLATGTPKLHD
jgi:hypothetical protein